MNYRCFFARCEINFLYFGLDLFFQFFVGGGFWEELGV